jgi:DNA-directed RNA polymerase specialized sigma24 family protein
MPERPAHGVEELRDHAARGEPLNVLRGVATRKAELEAIERNAMQEARGAGATFQEIGEALGVSRQAVHSKLKRLNGTIAVGPLGTPDLLGVLVLSLSELG